MGLGNKFIPSEKFTRNRYTSHDKCVKESFASSRVLNKTLICCFQTSIWTYQILRLRFYWHPKLVINTFDVLRRLIGNLKKFCLPLVWQMEKLVCAISFHRMKTTLSSVSNRIMLWSTNAFVNINSFLAPKQSRPCVCLAWHETETRLLAIGHDRNRSDHCITVWDTERGSSKENASLNLIGLSDTAHSLCWEQDSRILLAGMSHKYLKLMDLRQSAPTANVANTRAVYGVSIAPNGRLVASFIDNMICLWDLRNFDKPLSTHATEKNISDMCWCTTRNSTLSTLQRDSPFIHMLDFHCASLSETSDVETHSVRRIVSPFQKRMTTGLRNITMSNISWHPTHTERLLALSGSGIICDFRIPQRIAISWDPFNNLCGAIGNQLNCLNSPSPPSTPCESLSPWDASNINETSSNFSEDIADVMHQRAINDYGKLVRNNVDPRLNWVQLLFDLPTDGYSEERRFGQ